MDLTRLVLDRIESLDPQINSYITVMRDAALESAQAAEREIQHCQHRGPLHGIPLGLKDIFATSGVATTGHSRLFIDNVPNEDATVVRRLREAGAVIIGKHALYELSYGGPSFDLPFPPARNPWDIQRTPGGSSSGSAAAVAAALCLGAIGTDATGSIRQPASFSGIAGLKPTYGRVSCHGVIPNAYSLDHCGPLAWTSEDCAILLRAIAGDDPKDATSASEPTDDYWGALTGDLRGLRIGVVRHFYISEAKASSAVVAALDRAYGIFRELGADVDEVEVPSLYDFEACGRTILLAESFAVLEQSLRTRPYDFCQIGRERFMLGAFISASDYIRAVQLRRRLVESVSQVMRDWDILLTATETSVAPTFVAGISSFSFLEAPSLRVPFNVTGQPALSVCCGFDSGGLPIGMQIAGRPFDEATVLRVGDAYERATSWRANRPRMAVS